MKKLFAIIAVLAVFSIVSCQKNETDDISTNDKTEQLSNCIYYTTADGKKLTPYQTGSACFGAQLVSNTYTNGQGVLVFDDTITSIGDEAFRSCYNLASISIPNSVLSIGDKTFAFCTSLTKITIPQGVTSMGDEVFWGCTSLASIDIPNGVTSIGNATFNHCSKLRSITIPNSVSSIGEQAFEYCI